MYNVSRPYVDHASNRYNQYVQYMSQMDTSSLSNIADTYTSSIYGARDYINSGLQTLLNRNDVKYARSVSDQVLQHVSLNH